ncbi:PbsX family transcriptional regulator [Gallibacterium salpingitidis]|uniref:PbsX family transcriptional regulator n=1 Tax=Gallibacterium salpingitidis TaxID=505341 RepID=A0AB36DZV1_9PAST|nr:AbrB/MazE/SpoVT family DNA-binding domain-containing protein [Gallibacterium salpingitidis]OBX07255.1 PbsX family transcriptional regulator [Gallibacterium salpingitidis]OBX08314.1 PbsX family transcriptional regulator [Gallibacterium salpingitidis]WKS98557.1 AbrB/MazE/SpoVT family DNA-binding domain-containing protein [Gallibacterium salpingitidis]
MRLTIKKWGNSVGVRIPAAILTELQLKADSFVDIQTENGKIIIEPVEEQSLAQLLAAITEDNLHQEIDMGEPMGNEW